MIDNGLYQSLKFTSSFQEFLAKNVKKITENEYHELSRKCFEEVGDEKPANWNTMGVYSKWGWSAERDKLFKKLVESSGIKIKWNTEFEERLRSYIEEQGPNPGIGPFSKTEWYSQKRKELEDIMTREDNDVGC